MIFGKPALYAPNTTITASWAKTCTTVILPIAGSPSGEMRTALMSWRLNMLAVVKKPPIEFTVRGKIPDKYLKLLKKDFGPALSVFEDEETMPVTEMDWYKEIKEKETPGDTLRFYRRLHKMTQESLAAQISVTKQKISNMEHNAKPISRKTAYQLSEIFRISPGRFI
jgi:DNA-binding XRE family transcriptional regulator